jgi:flagellar biosynthetic protein FliR
VNANALLQQFSEQQVAAFICVLARISPLFLVAPMFSSKMVPSRVKGIAAVGLAVGMAPLAMKGQHVPLDVMGLVAVIAKEFLVGLAFAYALSVLFAAVSAAGSMADTLIGFSFGALVDPVTGNNASVLSQAYSLVGIAVFIAINGDAWVIQGLHHTYDLVPLTGTPALGSMVAGVQHAFAGIFVAAVELAARVVPQLNVFAVGFPAKVTVGLLIIGVSLPFAAGWISDQLQDSVSAALQSLKVA